MTHTKDEALKLALGWQNKDWESESPMSADLAISEANDVINALMQAIEASAVQEPDHLREFKKDMLRREHAAQPDRVAEPAPSPVPLTDELIGKAWAVADGEHNASASVKRRITRSIEAAHGITKGQL